MAYSETFEQQLTAVMTVGQAHIKSTLNSTNQWLLDHGRHGDVCLADAQSHGMGRRGRVWHSPAAENIYLSLCWSFPAQTKHPSWLSLLVGVELIEVLSGTGLQSLKLKWPNDIKWNHKKLAGILIQAKQSPQTCIIGIGINVNMNAQNIQDTDAPIDQAWCSLSQALGAEQSREQIILELVPRLMRAFESFPEMNVDELKQRWLGWDELYGRSVWVQDGVAKYSAVVTGLDQNGALLVTDQLGHQRTLISADVSVRTYE